ncbi:type III-A CRISPR-associated RAMP protein Csm4 [Fonticella tunisiensis]|uniref:CRISPR system Cms protein Csm4 n=1 Tax=Fonticella tunisiensis TaxID=1096341 RepID=A0A4R7KAA3_9CLOT|nr:type III-A CRISPR-associated RAMP protein Csm4 [Fonticella tunisiensis]TDT51294.1 CRISPR-associated Csm4 family protein [Fonticella tunisiensis]
MNRYRVKLSFKTPIHIGYREGAVDLTDTIIHSDTIFSGIINCYALLYGNKKTKELADLFLKEEEETPFMVSSAFYYVDDEYLIARPFNFSLERYTEDIKEDIKKDKKVKYISERVLFSKLEKLYIKGEFAFSKDIQKEIYKVEERPRVVVDRFTNATHIYYSSCSRFNEGCGLWFYLDVEDGIKHEIKSAIKLLADEGIGGERSYGYGQFDFSMEKIESRVENAKQYMLLSLCIPNERDDLEKLKAYGLIERTGYISSPYLKSKRYMLHTMIKEGSILGDKFIGNVVDNTPSDFDIHRVIKYGKAFLIPLGLEV